jgi:hypothetical protein
MAVYTVHEPPLRAGATSAPEPERFIFVRDGFSFAAVLFGPLWMLRHRMWLVLLGYGAVVGALALVLHLYASATVGVIVWELFMLLLGFEAGTLRRFTLGRRGFRNIGVVVADDRELAERRFFDAWVRKDSRVQGSSVSESSAQGQIAVPSGAPRMPRAGSDVLGLFPEPGASP